ncbi:HTH_Tnp_Tc3_2 domain-containing protein [Trichonephila clavipes]|nr:HTH_Tnp_Tc3_2 domain-containing protein [Trichonephila clavipes]
MHLDIWRSFYEENRKILFIAEKSSPKREIRKMEIRPSFSSPQLRHWVDRDTLKKLGRSGHRDETAGWSTRHVAGQVDRSECAVRNFREQWTREGTHARKTGSKATGKTTRREDQRIVRQALVDPTVTRSTIRTDIGVAIVPQTISRHLAEANLKSKRPFRALPLTPEHRQLRLQWCQARSMWNVTDWQKVVFSDESRFVLGTDDNHVRVWRHPVEWYNSPHSSTLHCPHSWCNGLGDIAYDSRSTL